VIGGGRCTACNAACTPSLACSCLSHRATAFFSWGGGDLLSRARTGTLHPLRTTHIIPLYLACASLLTVFSRAISHLLRTAAAITPHRRSFLRCRSRSSPRCAFLVACNASFLYAASFFFFTAHLCHCARHRLFLLPVYASRCTIAICCAALAFLVGREVGGWCGDTHLSLCCIAHRTACNSTRGGRESVLPGWQSEVASRRGLDAACHATCTCLQHHTFLPPHSVAWADGHCCPKEA